MNFIIKSRAYRYIASAEEEWLHPEKYVSKAQWSILGDGYLLMPDPRGVHLRGETIVQYRDGSVKAFDEYGRRPWQPDYGKERKTGQEGNSLFRFQGEFARLYGRYRRGRSFFGDVLDSERDSEELHQYHLGLDEKYGKGRGGRRGGTAPTTGPDTERGA